MFEKLKFLSSSVWDFLRPLIAILLSSVGPILIEAATNAVLAAQQIPNATGDEKRAAATKAVVEVLTKKGFEVGVAVVNAAVENAVVALKK